MNGDLVGAVGAAGVFLLMIVIVWQIALTWRARLLAAREDEYRKLAARYAELLEETVALQRHTHQELSETRAAVGSMERMMREIE